MYRNLFICKSIIVIYCPITQLTPERISCLPVHEINYGVFLVDGLARSAIYDTQKGDVYSINFSARDIILGQKTTETFYQKLGEKDIVSRYKLPTKIAFTTPPIDLEFMWLSLTSRCNLTCLHCYQESSPDFSEDKLMLKDWESVIRQGSMVGCRKLQFIGGEPLIFEKIFDLAVYANSLNYDFIEIFTNGTLINPARINTISDLGINIAISLYSNIPQVHDSVTTRPGSFDKTLTAMKLLKEAEVPTRIGVVVMKQNQHTVDSTLHMIQEFGFSGGDSADIIRAIGRGTNPEIVPDTEFVEKYGLMRRPSFITSQ